MLAAIAGALALTVVGWVYAGLDTLSRRIESLQERDRAQNARLATVEQLTASLNHDMDRIVAYFIRQHERNQVITNSWWPFAARHAHRSGLRLSFGSQPAVWSST